MKNRPNAEHQSSSSSSFWQRMYSEMKEDIFSGKLDSFLKGTAKKQPDAGFQDTERVYPAAKEGQEEKARDQHSKDNPPWRTFEDQAELALSESKIKELVRLCAHIRPGAMATDVDALVELSDGLLSADRLEDRKYWRATQRPCEINFSKDGENVGKIHRVVFRAAHHDPEGVSRCGSVEALLEAFPEAQLAFQSEVDARSKVEKVDLPTGLTGIIARIHFRSGVFELTEYAAAKRFKTLDDTFAQMDKENQEKAKVEQARRDVRDSLSLDERLARFRAPQEERQTLLGSDGCLRAWASGHSSWGESSNRWASFVNWLITQGTLDDRHHLVASMNWDHGLEIFHWIIRQPDTDIATAASIIWQGGASFHVPESAKGPTGYTEDYQLEGYDLLLETADRIRGSFYGSVPGHQSIGFVPPYQMSLDRDRPEVRAAEDRLMPEVARCEIAGRSGFELKPKIPEQYWNLLN